MTNLDNLEEIRKPDIESVLSAIQALPKQCQQAWEETQKLIFPKDYSRVKNIIVVGMGGSGFTPEIVKFVFADRLRVPYEVIHDYNLPFYANQDSLIVLSSYSGTTYEVLNAGLQALKKNLKIVGICRGAKLAMFLKQNKIPGYIFEETFNPSGQPRLGGGYMILGIMGILKKCGLLDISHEEVKEAINSVGKRQKLWDVAILTKENAVKNLALNLKDKIPIVVVAEFLEANGRALRSQLNESAKNFAGYQVIPELNHHLLEGLQFPKSNQENLAFLFIDSNLYLPENQKRFKITKEVIRKNKLNYFEITLEGQTKLGQVLELFSLGGFLSFYLALLNGVNPQKILWVDWFKKNLKNPRV